MITPPTYSAATNCQPISTTSTTPSSITRLVDANMKIIEVTKSAPLANRDFAIAEAAYEQDEESAPNTEARVTAAGPRSPSLARSASLGTNACTTPESPKPRISAQSVSQSMKKASRSEEPMPCSTAPGVAARACCAACINSVSSPASGCWPPTLVSIPPGGIQVGRVVFGPDYCARKKYIDGATECLL